MGRSALAGDFRFDNPYGRSCFAGFCAFVTLLCAATAVADAGERIPLRRARSAWWSRPRPLAVAWRPRWQAWSRTASGARRVIVPAAFLLAVPTLLAATATGFGQLLFWRFLQGVFTPGIFAVIIAYINEEWEEGAGAGDGGLRHRHGAGRLQRADGGRAGGGACRRGDGLSLLAVLDLVGALAIWAWLPAGKRFTRARIAARVSGGAGHAAAPAQSAAGGDLRGGLLRAVLAARHLYLRQLLPGGAALRTEHRGAGTAVRGVPGGRGGDAHRGARNRPLGPPLRAGRWRSPAAPPASA